MLITNSDYHYTNKMMSFAYNRFMPHGSTWRDLFDMVCSLSPVHQQRCVALNSSTLSKGAPEVGHQTRLGVKLLCLMLNALLFLRGTFVGCPLFLMFLQLIYVCIHQASSLL